MLAAALANLIEPCEDLTLVAVASDLSELRAKAATEKPDVILLSAPSGVDWEALRALRGDGSGLRLVLWVYDVSAETAHQAVENGIHGILRRTLPSEMILKCVRKVHQGELWYEKGLATTLGHGHIVRLSNREGDLIKLLSQGLKNKEIAATLGISEGTVKVYLSRLFQKVGAKDRVELALYGLKYYQYSDRRVESKPGSMFVGDKDRARMRAPSNLRHPWLHDAGSVS